MNKSQKQRGEGESGFLLLIIGIAVIISLGYFSIGWIKQIKENRSNYGKKEVNTDAPPPKSPEEMGGYEVTF